MGCGPDTHPWIYTHTDTILVQLCGHQFICSQHLLHQALDSITICSAVCAPEKPHANMVDLACPDYFELLFLSHSSFAANICLLTTSQIMEPFDH